MLPPPHTALRLAPPLTLAGRLLVPVVRLITLSCEGGGFASCTPVALLVGEAGAWSFVPLEEGFCQEDLSGIEAPPSPG
jgi:hypothetical protein